MFSRVRGSKSLVVSVTKQAFGSSVRGLQSSTNNTIRMMGSKNVVKSSLSSQSRKGMMSSSRSGMSRTGTMTSSVRNFSTGVSSSSLSSPLVNSLKSSNVILGSVAIFTGITVAASTMSDNESNVVLAFDSTHNFDKIKSQFDNAADVEVGNEKFMSIARFIQVTLHTDAATAKGLSGEMHNFISMIDSNGDGYISFQEFYGYVIMMESSDKAVEMAFRRFDLDNNGFVEQEEFERMIEATHGKHSLAFYESTGLLERFFGKDGKKHMTLDDFKQFRQTVKEELIRLEFRRLDTKRTGSISGRQFAQLLERKHHIDEHSYVAKSKNLTRFTDSQGKVSEDTYVAIVKMMDDIDAIEEAIKISTAGGHDISKKEFIAAVTGANKKLSKDEVDIVFKLFDVDGDGKLSYKEFVSVLKAGKSPLIRLGHPVSQKRLNRLHQDEEWAKRNKYGVPNGSSAHKGLAATMDKQQKQGHIFQNSHK